MTDPSGGLDASADAGPAARPRPPAGSPPPHRVRCAVLGAALLVVAGWFLVKEAIEPHWVIRLGDLVGRAPPTILALDDEMALHFYPDTRPHIGKITPVQKGGVLAQRGEELVEEGYGFGAPIVLYGGRSYLSQHAAIGPMETAGGEQPGRQLVKRFHLDVEDTWTQLLRSKYRPVPTLGAIVITYTVSAPGVLDVAADFTGLDVQPDLVYLANEQGARPFTRFTDSSGADRPFDDRADTPDQWIASTAERVCLVSPSRGVRFCILTQPDQKKYIGRERYFQVRWSGLFRLSWAGSDIELQRPTGVYCYRIIVERLR